MQLRLARLLLLLLAVLPLVGCSRRERVSTDYVLLTPETWNPDGHPGTALHYKGKQVWPNVYSGSSNSYHDGVFVFSAPVPTSDGQYNYSISPQLFAIRGAGPPVIVSQRIIEGALTYERRYRLCEVEPIETGVRAEFEYSPDHEHLVRTNCDVSWPDIQSWVIEAEASTPVTTTPLGTYRLLPLKSAAALRDKMILDAAISDILTNQQLSSERDFYGGMNVARVRYVGFPTAYKPEVAGFEFERLASTDSHSGAGLKLTIAFSGMWLDDLPPKDTYPWIPPEAPEKGVRLSIYNSGEDSIGATNVIGACCVGYEVHQTSDGWKVIYSRAEDP